MNPCLTDLLIIIAQLARVAIILLLILVAIWHMFFKDVGGGEF